VSAAEKAAKTTELLTVGLPSAPPGTAGIVGFADMPFYKIPFGQALDLVARRQVRLLLFLKKRCMIGVLFVVQEQDARLRGEMKYYI
jgi:hypothetical protein